MKLAFRRASGFDYGVLPPSRRMAAHSLFQPPAGIQILMLSLFLSGTAQAAAKKKPCAGNLQACLARGCAAKDTPNALSNIVKHDRSPQGALRTLTFQDFEDLQAQAETLFEGKYSTLQKVDRVRLRNLKNGGKKIGEGHFVEIVGYIAALPEGSEPHANSSGESVNCRLPKSANNDFHISLAPLKGGSEYEGIVVEMVPQQRDSRWTEARLRQVQKAGLQVRARGQLFFDNHHKVNKDQAHNIKNQPKRMSLWEVHPVTEFAVCAKTPCEAAGAGWKELEDWP